MNRKRIRETGIWLITALYLFACISPFGAAPPPTQAPEVLGTIIAQTAAAAQTQTAIHLPTSTLIPTSTPTFIPTNTPTLTPTLVPPIIMLMTATATPTVTLSFSSPSQPGSAGNGEEKSGYAAVIDKEWVCTVLEKSPPNGAIIGRGAHFSAVWSILNRGLKTWPYYGVDVVYRGGVRNDGRARIDMSSTITPGNKITIGISFTAPKDPGAYNSRWSLKVGRTYFCGMIINFNVK